MNHCIWLGGPVLLRCASSFYLQSCLGNHYISLPGVSLTNRLLLSFICAFPRSGGKFSSKWCHHIVGMYIANTVAKINTPTNQQPVSRLPPKKEFCNCSGHFLQVMFTMNQLYLVGGGSIVGASSLNLKLCLGNCYLSLHGISLTNFPLLPFIGAFPSIVRKLLKQMMPSYTGYVCCQYRRKNQHSHKPTACKTFPTHKGILQFQWTLSSCYVYHE